MTRIGDVVHVDIDEIELFDALTVCVGLLALVALRIVVGPQMFTGGVAILVTLLFARKARTLWKVFLFVGLYGALATTIAQNVSDRELAALSCVWIVTFVSGLAMLMPVTNAVVGIINVWVVMALNITPSGESLAQSAAAWLIGTGIGVLIVWLVRERGLGANQANVDFTRRSFEIHEKIRKNVLIFAFWRANAVTLAGGIGLFLFSANAWLPAMAALVVIGLSPVKSKLVAIQHAVGTLAGVLLGTVVESRADATVTQEAAVLILLFLTIVFYSASHLFFAMFMTASLTTLAGMLSDAPLKFGGIRLLETVVGIVIGLLALKLLEPALVPIAEHVRNRKADASVAQQTVAEPNPGA